MSFCEWIVYIAMKIESLKNCADMIIQMILKEKHIEFTHFNYSGKTVTMNAGTFRMLASMGCLALLFFSCKEQTTQPQPTDPYTRWKSYGYHNYTFEQTRLCFCRDGGEAMRVTVRSDTVSSVMRLSDSSMLSPDQAQYCLTLDSLFGLIRAAKYDSVVISYNAVYGYPERLDIDPQQHPVDGGVLYLSTNLRIP